MLDRIKHFSTALLLSLSLTSAVDASTFRFPFNAEVKIDNGVVGEVSEPPREYLWISNGGGDWTDSNTAATASLAWDDDPSTSSNDVLAVTSNSYFRVEIDIGEAYTGQVSVDILTRITDGYGNRARFHAGCRNTSGTVITALNQTTFYSNNSWTPRTISLNYTDCQRIYFFMRNIGQGLPYLRVTDIRFE